MPRTYTYILLYFFSYSLVLRHHVQVTNHLKEVIWGSHFLIQETQKGVSLAVPLLIKCCFIR